MQMPMHSAACNGAPGVRAALLCMGVPSPLQLPPHADLHGAVPLQLRCALQGKADAQACH